MFGLETDIFLLLSFCLLAACAFEFINGFHDTANAVATVIYTNSLKPTQAVVWSGIVNFIGVVTGGVGVGMSIVNLLPVELLIDQNVYHSIAMVLALLFSAIIWNFGTWYFGIPCSSSHTLIGSILGVGIMFSLLPSNAGKDVGVNWSKAGDIGLSLLISPMFGFATTVLCMYLLKSFLKDKKLFEEPSKTEKPPMWVRVVLFLTCTGVSFSHGSNDGQKGVGLIMLILICIVPGYFALNLDLNHKDLLKSLNSLEFKILTSESISNERNVLISDIKSDYVSVIAILENEKLSVKEKFTVRKSLLKTNKKLEELLKRDRKSVV